MPARVFVLNRILRKQINSFPCPASDKAIEGRSHHFKRYCRSGDGLGWFSPKVIFHLTSEKVSVKVLDIVLLGPPGNLCLTHASGLCATT